MLNYIKPTSLKHWRIEKWKNPNIKDCKVYLPSNSKRPSTEVPMSKSNKKPQIGGAREARPPNLMFFTEIVTFFDWFAGCWANFVAFWLFSCFACIVFLLFYFVFRLPSFVGQNDQGPKVPGVPWGTLHSSPRASMGTAGYFWIPWGNLG